MKKFRPKGLSGLPIGNFKIGPDGKLMRDEKAIDSKLDLCTRLKKRRSKKQTWKKASGANPNRPI